MKEYIDRPTLLPIVNNETKGIEFVSLSTIDQLNQMVVSGNARDVVNAYETRQEWYIGHIAWQIFGKRDKVKVIIIAGPSSSGKTTFSKRLALHLQVLGFKPYPLSLDDYFVDRDKTPLDANGEKDYEHIDALNVQFFRQNIQNLTAGGEIELPHYDFKTGTSYGSGTKLHLEEGMVLIVEGIHGLNPILTESLPRECVYKIYASSLARYYFSDECGDYVPRTDQRLVRRIIRDMKYRGISAKDTIQRWQSVRRGEDRWIFPFQENADVEFCSTQMYELAVLKNQALSALASVRPADGGYEKAQQLIDYLVRYETIEEKYIPPTSLLREFLGGSNFRY